MIDINIENIIKSLRDGDVLRLPTDTVYGYICDAENDEAVKKIYEMKKRDEKKPLGIFVSDINEFYKIIESGKSAIGDDIKNLLDAYWPGALTVICKKNREVLKGFNDGIDTIGVRIPKDESILSILKAYGKPLAETSANISGERDEPVKSGVMASTVIDISSGKIKIVREGNIKINI